MAFIPRVGLTPLTLKAEKGRIVDVETGSEWRAPGVYSVWGPCPTLTELPLDAVATFEGYVEAVGGIGCDPTPWEQ